MSRYIDADLLIGKIDEVAFEIDAYSLIIDAVEQAPTADVREVRRGKWVENEDGLHECSYCHKQIHYDDWDQPLFTEFCHGCGAEMEVE